MKKLTKKLFISAILAVSSCAFISSTPQFSTLAMEAQSKKIELSNDFIENLNNKTLSRPTYNDEIANLKQKSNSLYNSNKEQLNKIFKIIAEKYGCSSNFYKAAQTLENLNKECLNILKQKIKDSGQFYDDDSFQNHFDLILYYCIELNNIKFNLDNFEDKIKRYNYIPLEDSSCFYFIPVFFDETHRMNFCKYKLHINPTDMWNTPSNLIKPPQKNMNEQQA